jgi:hypothetical protein
MHTKTSLKLMSKADIGFHATVLIQKVGIVRVCEQ